LLSFFPARQVLFSGLVFRRYEKLECLLQEHWFKVYLREAGSRFGVRGSKFKFEYPLKSTFFQKSAFTPALKGG
jgi:hypothetical protein